VPKNFTEKYMQVHNTSSTEFVFSTPAQGRMKMKGFIVTFRISAIEGLVAWFVLNLIYCRHEVYGYNSFRNLKNLNFRHRKFNSSHVLRKLIVRNNSDSSIFFSK
jgi:hypothetical protein